MGRRWAVVISVGAAGLLTLGAQSASAVAAGSFAPTGSMIVPRGGPAAASLPDGRVLVAGGEYGNDFADCPDMYCGQILVAWRSAEIFDPATGSFAPTGSMTEGRVGSAAAPLPNGRVLIAGGTYHGNGFVDVHLQSAEIFDPATGSFSPTGSMTVPRPSAGAAPLPDGRVLIAGGGYYDRNSNSIVHLQSAEIFDPATGSFSPTGSMTVPRSSPAAAPLPDGRVLLIGGDRLDQQSAEIFDPATGSFAPTSMTVPSSSAPAAPLPDGRMLAIGFDKRAEIFDPATGSVAPTGTTIEPRAAAAAPLPDGRVLVAGGSFFVTHNTGFQPSAELFTPALSRKLRRTKLTATVSVAGTLTAADAKANKRRRVLKRTSASGGPGPIALKLKPVERAQRRLERTGKLRVGVRIRFTPAPVRGGCVTLTGVCYLSGYAITETATLTLKAKKRR